MKFTLPPRIEKRLEPAVLALIRRHVATRYRLLDGLAALTRRPAKDLEVAKERVARAAQNVAVDYLDGHIARREIAGQIDARAGRDEGAEHERTFAEFSRHTVRNLDRTLRKDQLAKRIDAVVAVLPDLTADADRRCIEDIGRALLALAGRAQAAALKLGVAPVHQRSRD